jgi:putative phosphoesterase
MTSRVLILADIHANPTALRAVLDDADEVNRILCAGDLVDYNPWPLEALKMVEENHITSVIGNHDRDCALGSPIGYNPYAQLSCVWTYNQLTEEAKRRLLTLPERIRVDVEGQAVFLCHGSPRDLVDEYVFPPPATPRELLGEYLREVDSKILVMGHTHVPFIEEFPDGWVVNPGSVGQPRDGDPRASYVLLTVEGSSVSLDLCRVEYNVDEVAERIIAVGLPHFLAQRLYRGI